MGKAGEWSYLSRAVEKMGQTIDVLAAQRDERAAQHLLTKAIRCDNQEHDAAIAICQVQYLNDIVEQDHCAVKRVIRPMLGS
jgi:putative transposase